MSFVKRTIPRLRSYTREITVVCFALTLIVLLISLFSHRVIDSCDLSVREQLPLVKNLAGFIGATIAGFLFSLCGVGALLLPVCYATFFYWFYWTHAAWRDEWERVCSLLFLVCLVDMGFALCAYEAFVPIGIVGSGGARLLGYFFSTTGVFLCLYLLAFCCVIFLLRGALIQPILRAIYYVKYMVSIFIERRVVQKIVASCFYGIARVVTTVWHCVKYLCGIAKKVFGYRVRIQTTTEVAADYAAIEKELGECFNERYESRSNDDQTMNSYVRAEKVKINDPVRSAAKIAEIKSEKRRDKKYQLPPLTLLANKAIVTAHVDDKELRARASVLEQKLEKFGVFGSVVSIKSGPVVALFEYQPRIDIKISKILSLEDDLALALQALSIRVIAPIPGTSVVGFEVAHKARSAVIFSAVIKSSFGQDCGVLPIVLGCDTVGHHVIADLSRMPHLLMAGSTGSGKSVALNCVLMSLLYRFNPDQLQLILIDPKRLEFATYAHIAHLVFPVIVDPKKVASVLRWVTIEMERRYDAMAQLGVRNIHDYNAQKALKKESTLSFVVVVIDELADLMITAGREIEDLIARIAQMARAAGIHLIVATQRPSVDVITGLIKVNFPSRIAFRVASKVDSRIILDDGGADKLLGRGDMLFLDAGGFTKRVHGAYASDEEIEAVVSHIRAQRQPEYQSLDLEILDSEKDVSAEDEELYKNIMVFLESLDEVSISLLQRKFNIGYNRSARIIELLEERGIIMPSQGGRPRKIIR
jgi:S-DNA-T family DNA segregation ATPase FtsK/SpoIIIE